jgi:putative hemolysin
VDEFGSVEGLVTPTDVLEAIAGDFTHSGAGETPEILPRGDGSYLVDGAASLDTISETFGIKMREEDDFHTVAGLVLDALGRIPTTGERLEIGTWSVEIVDMDGRRIDKLMFSPLTTQDEASAAISES